MPIRNVTFSYADNFPPVWATPRGVSSPHGCDIDPAFVSSYAGAQGLLQKIVPPGAFAAAIPGSTRHRILPRTRLAAASATNSPTLNVRAHTAQFFVPGDVIVTSAPVATIAIAATWLANETLTITVAGKTWVYTVPSPAPADNTALVNDIVTKSRSSALNGVVELVAAGTSILMIGLNDTADAYTVAETSTAGTALPASGNLTAGTSVGTVSAVNYNPDTNTHQLTLAANAAVALVAGTPIGDIRYSPEDLGMISPGCAVDVLRDTNTFYGLFSGIVAYRERLPYWDGQLKRAFPKIEFF